MKIFWSKGDNGESFKRFLNRRLPPNEIQAISNDCGK
jgi:hypothetical protein